MGQSDDFLSDELEVFTQLLQPNERIAFRPLRVVLVGQSVDGLNLLGRFQTLQPGGVRQLGRNFSETTQHPGINFSFAFCGIVIGSFQGAKHSDIVVL